MWEDPIVAEVRRSREKILASFGYDLEAYAAHIMALQEADKKRGVTYARPGTRRINRPAPDEVRQPDAA
jgi:hypothetical protein